MALYITNPWTSLVAIETILDFLNVISGFKINKEKSLLYPVSLARGEKTTLQEIFPYAWVKTSWKYLGLNIPLHFHTVNAVNMEELSSSVKDILKSLNEVIKTMIFPKFFLNSYFYFALFLL